MKTEPTQSPAKPGWEQTVKSWYRAYSKDEKLMVLETQERMIEFIRKVGSEAHAAGEKSGILKCIEKLENGTKSTKELFPYAVQAPTEEWALLCIEKDAYNRGVKDAEQALKSLLPLDTNN